MMSVATAIVVNVPAGEGARRSAEVWLCASSVAQVRIGRGENRGHTITYHNVVRSWRKLGEWTASDKPRCLAVLPSGFSLTASIGSP